MNNYFTVTAKKVFLACLIVFSAGWFLTAQEKASGTLSSTENPTVSENQGVSSSVSGNQALSEKQSVSETRKSQIALKNNSVPLTDDIYQVLDYYEIKGLLSPLGTAKPYTLGRILDAIDEICEKKNQLTDTEYEYFEEFKKNHVPQYDLKNWLGHCAISNKSEKLPVTFLYDFSLETAVSGGVYNNSDFNTMGYDIIPSFDFSGDITKYVSYNMHNFFDLSKMPLYECTDTDAVGYEKNAPYLIGYYWYEDDVSDFLYGEYKTYKDTEGKTQYETDENGNKIPMYVDLDVKDAEGNVVRKAEIKRRTIRKYKNNSYLPYAYHKPWAGQFYYLSNLSASGLEGWAMKTGISGGTEAEVRSSLFDNKVNLGIGRGRKEWAGMDNGASLVLNANAQPFFEADQTLELFPFLHFSSMVGILEYPNQNYIVEGAYPEKDHTDDAWVFQNAFSINMLDLDWKYVHLDLGSTVVWPKRFDLGYMFPLVFYVEYQNHIGDYDNMSLFADLKLKYPGLGSVWASMYLDELNVMSNWLKNTRVMYAAQVGAKAALPFLNSTTVSFRYTKVEPFCYTHNAVNYTPWYDHYITEAYMNNGESLGYYLDPNSDEFFLRLDSMFTKGTKGFFQYQFIRHGADYGSQQVPGSSLYSELSTKNRDELKKYFLHDGAYNWIHIANCGVTYSSVTNKYKLPFELSANLGFMYSYYTMIDDENYDRSIYGNNGNCADADFSTKYHFVDTDEYPVQWGFVLGAGAKIRL